MAVADQTVSERQRVQTRDALLAALLLIYQGRRRDALDALGRMNVPDTPSHAAHERLAKFADDRSRLIQSGINQRMDEPAGGEQPTVAARQQAMDQHNTTVLIPFLAAYAGNQALVDTYQDEPANDGSGRSAAEATLWTWTRNTDAEPDECAEADAASPTSLDALMSITGSPPPVHDRCQCSLEPD